MISHSISNQKIALDTTIKVYETKIETNKFHFNVATIIFFSLVLRLIIYIAGSDVSELDFSTVDFIYSIMLILILITGGIMSYLFITGFIRPIILQSLIYYNSYLKLDFNNKQDDNHRKTENISHNSTLFFKEVSKDINKIPKLNHKLNPPNWIIPLLMIFLILVYSLLLNLFGWSVQVYITFGILFWLILTLMIGYSFFGTFKSLWMVLKEFSLLLSKGGY